MVDATNGSQAQFHTLFKESINEIIIVIDPFLIDFGSQTICDHKQTTKENSFVIIVSSSH